MNRKTIARFAGFSAGAAMVLGFAAPVGAQTVAELQAQIAALMAQLQGLSGGSTASSAAITSDLTVGSSGADVVTLQTALVSQGYLVMPAGVPMGYFGALTKDAVAKWQAAHGVPATGYFGPMSRAAFGGSTTGGSTTGGTTTGGSTGSLQGGEGSLDVVGNLSNIEDEVDEGDEEVNVLGIELEAEDSDIMLERVDVDITVGANGSSQLNNYITEVHLMLDGDEIASLDVDEGDEDSDDVFSFRFTGLNGVIEEDETGELYVAVSAVNNVDSGDTDVDLSVDVPADGIRAVDASGLSDTYATAGDITAETFSIAEPTAGDLDLSEGDDNPDTAEVVFIDEDEDTDDVLVLAFDLEADNQDVVIDAIPVGFVSTGDDVDGAANRVILEMDGDVIDTISIPSTATTTYLAIFDDLDIELGDGETAEFKVFVDLNDADLTTFASGTTMTATTTASHGDWDVEDDQGDSVTPSGGTVTGGTQTYRTGGVSVASDSTSATAFPQDTADNSYATYTITFEVSATDEDAYIYNGAASTTISATVGVGYDIESTTWPGGTESAVLTSSADMSGNYWVVDEGTTEEFTLTVTLNATSTGTYSVELTEVGSAATAVTATQTTSVDESDSAFQTNAVYIPS